MSLYIYNPEMGSKSEKNGFLVLALGNSCIDRLPCVHLVGSVIQLGLGHEYFQVHTHGEVMSAVPYHICNISYIMYLDLEDEEMDEAVDE